MEYTVIQFLCSIDTGPEYHIWSMYSHYGAVKTLYSVAKLHVQAQSFGYVGGGGGGGGEEKTIMHSHRITAAGVALATWSEGSSLATELILG